MTDSFSFQMTRAPPAEGPFNVLMVSFITLETDLAVHGLLRAFFCKKMTLDLH